MKTFAAFPVAVSLALVFPAVPAHAGGDITNFNVRNCTPERIFVCSFDKTDGSLKIPYKAGGIPPTERKEFGCASLDKCKVIVGVSKRTTKRTLSTGMEAALATGAAMGGVGAGIGGTILLATEMMVPGAATAVIASGGAIAGAIIAVGAGGTVAGLEISDGWSDGEVCNQVRKAAQKAGMKPKSFMKNGKVYRIVEQYGTDENGNPYVNPDGTAVFAYSIEQDRGKCPTSLATQLVKN